MKLALAAICMLALGLPALSQEPVPTAESQRPPEAAPDPEAVQRAQKLLDEVAEAYKKASALTDTIKMEMETPRGNQSQEMEIALGAGTDAELSLPGFTVTSVGGKLYLVRDGLASKYLVVDVKESVGEALNGLFENGGFTPPQLAMRENQGQQERLDALTMGIMQNAQITGHQMSTDDGESMHEVTMSGDGGKGSVLVDPGTKLIEKIKLEMSPPQAPGFTVQITMSMSPKIHESLPQAIAFEPKDRRAVDSLDKLVAVAVGDVPPDFTLPTLNGETVTLSNLKGSAVVLDFWATWCRPCRAVLPKLQQFSTWAETSGRPVKVFALNTFERFPTPEETRTKVSEFWGTEKFTMPVLLDLDSAVGRKYEVSSIPMTVIVGPDGKIFRIHQGVDPKVDFVEELKKDVEEAMKVGGGSG